jgi:hypothetical protein
MDMKKVIISFAMLMLACYLNSQSLVQTMDVRNLTDSVMKDLLLQKYAAAMDRLKPISHIEASDLDRVATTFAAQIPSLGPHYGNLVGYDLVWKRQLGTSLLELIYLLKFEKKPLKLAFGFYNGGTGWYLVNFDFNDKIDDLHLSSASDP